MNFASSGLPNRTIVGLSYGPGVEEFVDRNPGLVDYIELPFELLQHDPAVTSVQQLAPLILHCASMSVAGFVRPSEGTLDAIAMKARQIGTPWIGEHLAFMSADPLERGAALHEPTTLTYTVCPQLSEEVLQLVSRNLAELQTRFPVPLIVENSPQYFVVPGSTMSIVDFTIEVHRRCDVGMLLDLTHFTISSMNMRFNPREEIVRLPLEKLVEMHISGLDMQSDTAWDDHAAIADESIFELAEIVFDYAQPKALTFEYNWAPDLPDGVLVGQMTRMREILQHA